MAAKMAEKFGAKSGRKSGTCRNCLAAVATVSPLPRLSCETIVTVLNPQQAPTHRDWLRSRSRSRRAKLPRDFSMSVCLHFTGACVVLVARAPLQQLKWRRGANGATAWPDCHLLPESKSSAMFFFSSSTVRNSPALFQTANSCHTRTTDFNSRSQTIRISSKQFQLFTSSLALRQLFGCPLHWLHCSGSTAARVWPELDCGQPVCGGGKGAKEAKGAKAAHSSPS